MTAESTSTIDIESDDEINEKQTIIRNPFHSFLQTSLTPFFISFLPKFGFFLEIIWYSHDTKGILTTSYFSPFQIFTLVLSDWLFTFAASTFQKMKNSNKNQFFIEMLRLHLLICIILIVICFSMTKFIVNHFSSFSPETAAQGKIFGYLVNSSMVLHILLQVFYSYFTTSKTLLTSIIPFVSFFLEQVILIPIGYFLIAIPSHYLPLYKIICDLLSIIASICFIHFLCDDFQFSPSSLLLIPSKEFLKLVLENLPGLFSSVFQCIFYYIILHAAHGSLYSDSDSTMQAIHLIFRFIFLLESPCFSFDFPLFKISYLLVEKLYVKTLTIIGAIPVILCIIWFAILIPVLSVLKNHIFSLFFPYSDDSSSKIVEFCESFYSPPLYTIWLCAIYQPISCVLIGMKTKGSFILPLIRSLVRFIAVLYLKFTNSQDINRIMYSFIASDISTMLITLVIGMPSLSICAHTKQENTDETPLSGD